MFRARSVQSGTEFMSLVRIPMLIAIQLGLQTREKVRQPMNGLPGNGANKWTTREFVVSAKCLGKQENLSIGVVHRRFTHQAKIGQPRTNICDLVAL